MNYWKNAEQLNGRMAMMGFFAAVINYGFTGWVIPGIGCQLLRMMHRVQGSQSLLLFRLLLKRFVCYSLENTWNDLTCCCIST